MYHSVRLGKSFRIILTLLICALLITFAVSSCDSSKDQKAKVVTRNIITDTGFHGWEAITLANSFVRLNLVPELSGKIMGYQPVGTEILWHNPALEGEIDVFQQNDIGDEFVNTGGAKVWPAPQRAWGGPPDRILDGLPYETEFDGTTIIVTSPEDVDRTGLQYKHTYSLRHNSTCVDLSLSMTNISNKPIEWSLWHLTTVPADRSATIYVPVASNSNWEIMHGPQDQSSQWIGVENGVFKARYGDIQGKVGMKVSDGWIVWYDEDNNIAFTLMFPVHNNRNYPHNGHHVELWSTGPSKSPDGVVSPEMSHMELEVLGPLENLEPGKSASNDIVWASCFVTNIEKVLPIGIISQNFKKDENNTITASFGSFYGGTIEEYFIDEKGEKCGRSGIMDVSPISECRIIRTPVVPLAAVAVQYRLVDYNRNVLGVFGELPIRNITH